MSSLYAPASRQEYGWVNAACKQDAGLQLRDLVPYARLLRCCELGKRNTTLSMLIKAIVFTVLVTPIPGETQTLNAKFETT